MRFAELLDISDMVIRIKNNSPKKIQVQNLSASNMAEQQRSYPTRDVGENPLYINILIIWHIFSFT